MRSRTQRGANRHDDDFKVCAAYNKDMQEGEDKRRGCSMRSIHGLTACAYGGVVLDGIRVKRPLSGRGATGVCQRRRLADYWSRKACRSAKRTILSAKRLVEAIRGGKPAGSVAAAGRFTKFSRVIGGDDVSRYCLCSRVWINGRQKAAFLRSRWRRPSTLIKKGASRCRPYKRPTLSG